jgi:hypothetical protein
VEARKRKKAIFPRELVQSEMKTHTRRLVEGLACTVPEYDTSSWPKNAAKRTYPSNVRQTR